MSSKYIPTSNTSSIFWPARWLMAIFIVAMIGGGITFIDDKSRGLHEGYLVTPIHKTELVLGLIGAGAFKGLMAGMALTIIGGAASLELPASGIRCACFISCWWCWSASTAMISFMFLLMVRVDDPLVPRAIFGVLNTLLFFPSGAVYPIEGFPLVAALDFCDRPVHLHRARAPQSHH